MATIASYCKFALNLNWGPVLVKANDFRFLSAQLRFHAFFTSSIHINGCSHSSSMPSRQLMKCKWVNGNTLCLKRGKRFPKLFTNSILIGPHSKFPYRHNFSNRIEYQLQYFVGANITFHRILTSVNFFTEINLVSKE